MKHNTYIIFPMCSLLGLLNHSFLYGQKLNEKLSAFESLIDKKWHGQINDIDIIWSMRPILNGMGIRKELHAPSIKIKSETTIYWDLKKSHLSFLRITSQGYILEGKIVVKDNLLIFEGLQTKTDSTIEFKNTLELINENKIIDIWYDNDGIGHNIKYIANE